MSIQHSQLSKSSNHAIYSFEYANELERNSAIGFNLEDVGKIA